MDNIPKVHELLIISDDEFLAAQISSLVAKRGHYTAVIDCPRLTRMDARNEIVRRNNVAARIQPNLIILANVSNEIEEGFEKHFPRKIVQCVSDIHDFKKTNDNLITSNGKSLIWGKDNIGIGLLSALRQKKELVFCEGETTYRECNLEAEHIVVCEEGNLISQIVAANYAYSIGAGMLMIPQVPEEEAEGICEAFYSSSEKSENSQHERLDELKNRLRKFSGNIPIKGKRMLTFITSKLPWGFAYPEIPTTHIFSYPDMGASIVHAIVAEQPNTTGLSLGILIDPENVEASEIEPVKMALGQRGMLLKILKGSGANVYDVSRNIALLPYDFLLISTHCGDAKGWEWTYDYKDSEGIQRKLVIHTTIGVGHIPHEEDMLEVLQFSKFVSLDGVDWTDLDAKKDLYVGTAIKDFIEKSKSSDDFKPTKKVSIGRVVGSSALKMSDNNYIFVPEQIGGENLPIVINNACCSWHRLAGDFVFSNARVYIGTLFDVLNSLASEIAIKLTQKYFDKQLAVAIWRAQNDVYGDTINRPYVMVGPHFQKLRITREDKAKSVLQKMIKSGANMARSIDHEQNDDYVTKKTKENMDFLKEEIASVADMISKRKT